MNRSVSTCKLSSLISMCFVTVLVGKELVSIKTDLSLVIIFLYSHDLYVLSSGDIARRN